MAEDPPPVRRANASVWAAGGECPGNPLLYKDLLAGETYISYDIQTGVFDIEKVLEIGTDEDDEDYFTRTQSLSNPDREQNVFYPAFKCFYARTPSKNFHERVRGVYKIDPALIARNAWRRRRHAVLTRAKKVAEGSKKTRKHRNARRRTRRN